MRTNKAIIIPVFEYTEDEYAEMNLGLKDPKDNSVGFEKVQNRAFWSIDSAHTYDDDLPYGSFYSGGTSFISPLTKEELIQLINNHNR